MMMARYVIVAVFGVVAEVVRWEFGASSAAAQIAGAVPAVPIVVALAGDRSLGSKPSAQISLTQITVHDHVDLCTP